MSSRTAAVTRPLARSSAWWARLEDGTRHAAAVAHAAGGDPRTGGAARRPAACVAFSCRAWTVAPLHRVGARPDMLTTIPNGTPVVDGPYVYRLVASIGGYLIVCSTVFRLDEPEGYTCFRRSSVLMARGVAHVIRCPADRRRVEKLWNNPVVHPLVEHRYAVAREQCRRMAEMADTE
jgi:hypothetical protein